MSLLAQISAIADSQSADCLRKADELRAEGQRDVAFAYEIAAARVQRAADEIMRAVSAELIASAARSVAR